LQLAFSA